MVLVLPFFFKDFLILPSQGRWFTAAEHSSFQEAYTGFGVREQRNPFLYVVVPNHLRETKIHKQLMINSQEIVTHHDLHSTFKDILYVRRPTAQLRHYDYSVAHKYCSKTQSYENSKSRPISVQF